MKKKPKCVKCGRTEKHWGHEQYGNDVNNPRKHTFRPAFVQRIENQPGG